MSEENGRKALAATLLSRSDDYRHLVQEVHYRVVQDAPDFAQAILRLRQHLAWAEELLGAIESTARII